MLGNSLKYNSWEISLTRQTPSSNFLWTYISEADAAAAAAMRSAVWYFNSFCSNSDKNFMSWNLYIFYLAHSIVVATGAAATAADVAATTYKLHNATNTSAAADCLNRFGWLAVSLSDLYSMYFSVCLSVGMYVYKYRKITCNAICLCVCVFLWMHTNILYIVNIFHIYIYILYICVCVCVKNVECVLTFFVHKHTRPSYTYKHRNTHRTSFHNFSTVFIRKIRESLL